MIDLKKIVYNNSPFLIQNFLISCYGLVWKRRRMGKIFKEELKKFIERERYSLEEFENYQENSLRVLLLYCYNNISYYKEVFSKLGLTLKDLENFHLKDLKKLPFLEKKDIQEDPKRFMPKSGKNLYAYETGGTTGTPLKVYYSSKSHQRVFASHVSRIHFWAGVEPTDKHVTFGGRDIFKDKDPKNRYWRYNIFEKQLYFSAFHLSPLTVKDCIKKINSFKPLYINGYTSAIYYVAKFILEEKYDSIKIKAALLSSDKLTSSMRDTIQKAWECETFDGYSSVEGCCLISECEFHKYHISPDVGIVEIIKENGEEAKEGEEGEIVCTGLLNYDFPLIRYKIGDFAVKSKDKICNCRREMPLVEEILGREEDYLILKDGRASASFSKAFEGVEGIIEGQVIQEDYDKIKIFLVKSQKFNEKEKEKFLENIYKLFGKLQVEIIFTEKIERTKRGKLKLVISKLKEKIKNG